MDRLAAHVIATAALTVTLATVPVLFADASHAATRTASVPAAAADPSPSPAGDTLPGTVVRPPQPPRAAGAQTAPSPAAGARSPRSAPRTAWTRPPRPAGRPCADVRQVGGTAHALYHGMIAFSVRQYYSSSCDSYYGYSFVWSRFRKLHVRYDVGMAVDDTTRDAIDGARTYIGGAGGPAYWSVAVPAAKGECTQGDGHYFYYPAHSKYGFEEADTVSPKVCA
jgi:hypothetical protein